MVNSAILEAGATGIADLGTNTSSILVAFVAVSLLFVGYRYLRKSGVK